MVYHRGDIKVVSHMERDSLFLSGWLGMDSRRLVPICPSHLPVPTAQ